MKNIIKRLQTVYDYSTLGDIPIIQKDIKDFIQYVESEIDRARKIYEPLEERMNEEFDLDSEEMTDMDYYQGYADGMMAVLNKINYEKNK